MKISRLGVALALAISCCAVAAACSSGDDAGVASNTDGGLPEDASIDSSPLDSTVKDSGSRDSGNDADAFDGYLPLRIPPVAVPASTDGGVDYYDIHVKAGTQQVMPSGPATTIWGFEGQWPGPTIAPTLGHAVAIRIYNDLPVAEGVSIHNHGQNVIDKYDGHPSTNVIATTSSYQYVYPNTQLGGSGVNARGSGTYFLHDEAAGFAGAHLSKGVAAFYLIQPSSGSNEATLNLPTGAFDIPMMIQDRTFNADNSLSYVPAVIPGTYGDTLLVNGTPHPKLDVGRRKYRFRLLNASDARSYILRASSGTMTEVASDGHFLPSSIAVTSLTLAPGERADIVMDFSSRAIGDVVTLLNDETSTPLLTEILQLRVTHDDTDTSSLPATLDSSFVRYTATVPTVTRSRSVTVGYDSGATQWTFNGSTYNPSANTFTDTKLGDVEVWTLVNDTSQAVSHPFHQHLVPFQIIDVCAAATPACGTAPPAQQQGWKDTVVVAAHTAVRIKMQFAYTGPETASTVFPGEYVFQCNSPGHQDTGLMLQQLISAP